MTRKNGKTSKKMKITYSFLRAFYISTYLYTINITLFDYAVYLMKSPTERCTDFDLMCHKTNHDGWPIVNSVHLFRTVARTNSTHGDKLSLRSKLVNVLRLFS